MDNKDIYAYTFQVVPSLQTFLLLLIFILLFLTSLACILTIQVPNVMYISPYLRIFQRVWPSPRSCVTCSCLLPRHQAGLLLPSCIRETSVAVICFVGNLNTRHSVLTRDTLHMILHVSASVHLRTKSKYTYSPIVSSCLECWNASLNPVTLYVLGYRNLTPRS
jgi:hypothetical protein